jgi:hypothetical protein
LGLQYSFPCLQFGVKFKAKLLTDRAPPKLQQCNSINLNKPHPQHMRIEVFMTGIVQIVVSRVMTPYSLGATFRRNTVSIFRVVVCMVRNWCSYIARLQGAQGLVEANSNK